MTRLVRQALSVLVAALVVVLAAGCTGEPRPPTTSTTSGTPTPSAASPSLTPVPSPEDAATPRAEEVVRSYLRAQTDCLTDPPATEITCFEAVAIGTELVNLKNALTSAQAMETRVVGEIVVAAVELQGIDLTSDPAASPPVVPTIVFDVCADVSGYNVVDKDGRSIVPPDRAATSPLEVSVYNYEYPDQTQWRVGYVVAAEDLACGG
ncbi:hypothetical protein [Cellulomonas sp. C5510]|uniref:hypothetical protein n=1 Tax=Cellulomonas sp. C5510 TaxID=2871170 RepID=UPI001C98BEB6|nr:hypothetical protein [Cellulomonas sp. C5510]QZN87022.1 hypothetical protein K5O09_07905 [Cellulomonas sp. C5510]